MRKPKGKILKTFKVYVNTAAGNFCLSMRQISLCERMEIVWFTRDI